MSPLVYFLAVAIIAATAALAWALYRSERKTEQAERQPLERP